MKRSFTHYIRYYFSRKKWQTCRCCISWHSAENSSYIVLYREIQVELVWTDWGPCVVRSKLYKFEHVQGLGPVQWGPSLTILNMSIGWGPVQWGPSLSMSRGLGPVQWGPSLQVWTCLVVGVLYSEVQVVQVLNMSIGWGPVQWGPSLSMSRGLGPVQWGPSCTSLNMSRGSGPVQWGPSCSSFEHVHWLGPCTVRSVVIWVRMTLSAK